MSELYERYKKEIIPAMIKEFGYKNPVAVPKIEKIVLNVGLGEAVSDKNVIEKVISYLATVTGQKGVAACAKKSIAGFKLRAGQPIGVKITLRRKKMYDFLEKLIKVVLPRTRDFKGVSLACLDEHGNCTLGFSEQLIFPEIEYGQIDKARGLGATIVTTTRKKEEGKRLLELLGIPFEKNQKHKVNI